MGSLNTFIKDVRESKTHAEKRQIITKESAKIRTRLKDDHLSKSKRRKAIQKLLYLFVLGEKTHFAQVECINLIASEEFVDKRLGYLAAMLLLDESQELLTLLTNQLRNDLNSTMKYVVSLALSTLGTLMSPGLARDLYYDVENILKTSRDPYLLKKALQCAARILQIDSGVTTVFYPYISLILTKNELCVHGVLFGVNKLAQAVLGVENFQGLADYKLISESIANIVPLLISVINSMYEANFSSEFDAHGVCDPFLQVEVLRTLRSIFLNIPQAVASYFENLSEVLVNMSTNIDLGSNSANSVQYEILKTIFAVQAERSLKVQVLSIFGRLLSSKDVNTKYIALNTLLQVVSVEPEIVQLHRNFIFECLFDSDISIKKRASELIINTMEDSNMKESVHELIKFLDTCCGEDHDHILYIVEHLINIFGIREIKEEEWKLNVMIQIIKIVGQHLTPEIIGDILVMLNNMKAINVKKKIVRQILQSTLHKERTELSEDNFGLRLIAVWVIGEYSHLVLGDSDITDDSLVTYLCYMNNLYSDETKLIGYIMTASLKLSVTIKNPVSIEKLRRLIDSHSENTDLTIQTKSIHYAILFNQPATVKKQLLEPMPIFIKNIYTDSTVIENKAKNSPPFSKSNYKDLLEEFLDPIPASTSVSNDASHTAFSLKHEARPGEAQNVVGILSSNIASFKHPETTSNDNSEQNNILIPEKAVEIYSSENFDIFSNIISSKNGDARLELFFKAHTQIKNLIVFAAVPKTQRLTLGPLSNANLSPGKVSKQLLNTTGSGMLKIRLKLNFNNGISKQFDHKFDVSL